MKAIRGLHPFADPPVLPVTILGLSFAICKVRALCQCIFTNGSVSPA